MKKTLKFLYIVQSSRVRQETHIRLNFIMQNIGSLCYFVTHLIAFWLFINRLNIPGWTKSEAWVLLMSFEFFTYSAFFLFYKGFRNTITDIHRGGLDSLLVKPLSSRLIAQFRGGGSHNFICVVISIVSLVIIIAKSGLSTSPLSWLIYLLGIAGSLSVLANLTWILICLNFSQTPFIKASEVLFEIQDLYKYPPTVLSPTFIYINLLIIPFMVINSVPVALLIQKTIEPVYLATFISLVIISYLASKYIWGFSMSKYSSAN